MEELAALTQGLDIKWMCVPRDATGGIIDINARRAIDVKRAAGGGQERVAVWSSCPAK